MYNFFSALANAIVDRSADELIGAVMVALGISLTFAGVDFVARRKVRDNRMPMVLVMIAASLTSMAFAAGYIVYSRKPRGAASGERMPGFPLRVDSLSIEALFRSADQNHDGLVSSEEAALAASDFVQRADATGNGMIDEPTLEQALRGAANRRGRRPTVPAFPK